MQDMWTYRKDIDTDPIELDGFDVEARDGAIGKIDEATNDVSASFVIVDTGPWIFGRKVLIPARAIERLDLEGRTAHVGLTKDQIKASPEYDGSTMRGDAAYREQVGSYYGPFFGDPVI
jgi:hypothetical protein